MRPMAEWRVLEILERGRYLNAGDTRHSSIALVAFSPKFAPPERICLRPDSKIAEIVAKRGVRY